MVGIADGEADDDAIVDLVTGVIVGCIVGGLLPLLPLPAWSSGGALYSFGLGTFCTCGFSGLIFGVVEKVAQSWIVTYAELARTDLPNACLQRAACEPLPVVPPKYAPVRCPEPMPKPINQPHMQKARMYKDPFGVTFFLEMQSGLTNISRACRVAAGAPKCKHINPLAKRFFLRGCLDI